MTPTTYQPLGASANGQVPITPIAPPDDRSQGEGRDFAAAGKFSIYALERMLRDCTSQPTWRLRAKVCAAYYDGKQIDHVRRSMLQQEDLDERVVNLIRPIINSVLGQEAKARTDVKIEADDDDMSEVVEVISAKLKEAERETAAHMAVSNAYASMVKKGIGWLHVCRNADPLAYPYRFEDVPMDEVWWDWRGQKGTTLDDRCRWLARMRMIDLDEILAMMPEHKAVLEQVVNGWDDPRMETLALLGEPEDMRELSMAMRDETRFNASFRRYDWVDSARKMIKLIEVWYRVPATVVCLQLSPSRRIPFDPQNPRHVEAVARKLVPLVKGPTSQVRRALYAGPYRLYDEATTRKRFPYIPLFAYRDDEDGSPYGLIDGMIAPQDDYNDRRHRIQWMLKARQLFIDSDAVDTRFNTIAEIAANVNRPDLVAVLNANRKNPNGLVIGNTLSVQKEQFALLDQAELLVQKAAGRYSSQLGDAQVQSGIANSILVEQGEQAMGEMNDNYVTGRRAAFECLTDLIVEDHLAPNMPVMVGTGHLRRTVILNTYEAPMGPATDPRTGQPVVDPATGQPQMVPVGPPMPKNMVADTQVRTALAEVPSTPAYKAQTRQQLGEIIKGLAGNAPALNVLTPYYVEVSGMDNAQEAADDIRRATGQPLPGDKQGRMAAQQQMQQQAVQAAKNAQDLEHARVEDLSADATFKYAEARKTNAEAEALERGLEAGKPELDAANQHASLRQTNQATDAAEAAANDPNAIGDDAVKQAMQAIA